MLNERLTATDIPDCQPRFFERPYPSANSILLPGAVLVDPGCATAIAALLVWLGGVQPTLIVNTHWHSDHSGANAAVQRPGVPIAAAAAEAQRINAGDPDAHRAHWLRQTVPPYRVERALLPGDTIGAWSVVPLPGHNADQIGLWSPADRILICGDALAQNDVGWLDIDADPRAIDQAEESIAAIAGLGPRLVLPGHGPAITDLSAALKNAMRRLASWRAQPERIAWHACKRIFLHALLMERGLKQTDTARYLLTCPWFQDTARRAFNCSPEDFVQPLLDELIRSGLIRLESGWFYSASPTVL
jgi:glyoxylase-like metal-dependent hydrolase (beta-lactamase superfamily II)